MQCGACYLSIDQPELVCLIWLPGFRRRRGDGEHQRPLSDLGMATRLVECLALDRWPSPATVVDFGIDSPSHLGALQHAVCCGISAYDLDRVMGSGYAITRLVRAVPDQPALRAGRVPDGVRLPAGRRRGGRGPVGPLLPMAESH